jgi:hypothetical protein
MIELEQRAQRLLGASQARPARGQEDHQSELVAEKPDQDEDNFLADVEQYHIFTTLGKDKRNDLWYEAEVNAGMPVEPQFMHWSKAAITWGARGPSAADAQP